MTPTPVPLWLRLWAWATAVLVFVLLGLGSVVTTFRVGMEDPIWPTTPWHLFFIDWTEPSRGYLIEHAHRLVAFAVGGVVALLALFLWLREPRASLRWIGLVSLVCLLVSFGLLHRVLMDQAKAAEFHWPLAPTVVTLTALAATLGCAAVAPGALSGSGIRLGMILVLVGVMVQGLLGGLRVRLNELVGTDLALLHGVVAQVIFAGLVALTVVLRSSSWPAGESVAGGLRALAWGVVALLVLQLYWGALLRQTGATAVQRLHFLTAFAVVGGIVWLVVAIASRAAARREFGWTAVLLGVLVAGQLVLGVETWFRKFSQGVLPEMQQPVTTATDAVIRTLHVLVGAILLATATALATRASLAASEPGRDPLPPRRTESERPVGVGV